MKTARTAVNNRHIPVVEKITNAAVAGFIPLQSHAFYYLIYY